MAIRRFLAFTEAEMDGISELPENAAWMERLFLPETEVFLPALPADSLLVLTDETPFLSGSMGGLCGRIRRSVSESGCCGVVLDLQREKTAEAEALVEELCRFLPVILPPEYAAGRECGVFLPPLPADVSLEEYLRPWQGRETWLELALDGLEITLTEAGAVSRYLPYATPLSPAHRDHRLHCHYHIHCGQEAVRFTLWRTREDVEDLVSEAEGLGVMGCVGLWQEFKPSPGGKVPRTGG